MSKNQIKMVRDFIINNFLFGDDEDFREDESFLENGIVDSTGVLELVEYLEDTFKISVEDEEMIPENLDSLRNIEKYLKTKLKAIT